MAGLSPRERIAFWLTNLPYWALAAWLLAFGGRPPAHAAAVTVVAAASTAFHGAVMFGGGSSQYERVTRWLFAIDVLCAHFFGVALAMEVGFTEASRIFFAPVLLLTASAVLKRRGSPRGYAWVHGAWHVVSAIGMWRVLSEPAA